MVGTCHVHVMAAALTVFCGAELQDVPDLAKVCDVLRKLLALGICQLAGGHHLLVDAHPQVIWTTIYNLLNMHKKHVVNLVTVQTRVPSRHKLVMG